jgi:hypothetical protein
LVIRLFRFPYARFSAFTARLSNGELNFSVGVETLCEMKIFPAEIADQGGKVNVSYRFETPSRPELGGVLWYRVDARYRDWIATGPEPGMAALAFLAMALGENVEVAQPVSSRFHHGLLQFIEFFHLWEPQHLKRIGIVAPGFGRTGPTQAKAVAACFSGGVDSFHTLYAHLGEAMANPDYRLTHLFFAHGFDIPLDNAVFGKLAAEYDELAKSRGLGFIGLATNIRQFLDPHVPWLTTHGAVIAACAQLLAAGAKTFIIPSTNRHSVLFSPSGSNPVTDPLLGNESLEIVHDGSHCSRIQKILAIAHQPEAQQHLRVCWQNVRGLHNCGRCVKCLKVMMPLALEGVLDKFTLFPPLPPWAQMDKECFAPLDLSHHAPELTYASELRALALARQNPKFAAAVASLAGIPTMEQPFPGGRARFPLLKRWFTALSG